MKYILTPLLLLVLVVFLTFVVAPVKFLHHLVWNFKVISFKEAASDTNFQGEKFYLYDCSFKQFVQEILFPYRSRNKKGDEE